jgi:hypothetical protein
VFAIRDHYYLADDGTPNESQLAQSCPLGTYCTAYVALLRIRTLHYLQQAVCILDEQQSVYSEVGLRREPVQQLQTILIRILHHRRIVCHQAPDELLLVLSLSAC